MTGRPTKNSGAGASRDGGLTDLLEPVVTGAGFDLEDVVVSAAGRRKIVKVVVDGDSGISLDDVAVISRAVSEALDANDDGFGASPYTLEVTSPGVDRPLTTERHWRRAVGRLVRYTVDDKVTEARVESVDGDQVTIERDGTRSTHSLADLSPGRVQVEFSSKRTSKE